MKGKEGIREGWTDRWMEVRTERNRRGDEEGRRGSRRRPGEENGKGIKAKK